jgi:glycosyltransferase involved in cell wall biosynthesis
MYKNNTVGIVVPAYNEAGYVGDVIDSIPAIADRVYVIDDGSTDDTWSEITNHAARRNDGHDGVFADLVVPIRHDHNRGVGGAIKTGYQRAREEKLDVTAVLGGDDQMNPDELTRYLDPVVSGQADYAKGNRFSDPDHWAKMPTFRLVGNVILSYLTKIASGYWHTMDSQNGYSAISLQALEETDIDGMYEYYGYCNDLLVRLNTADIRVADVPRSSEFAYSDDWKSHIEYKEYVPRVSVMLFRGFIRRIVRKHVLMDYHPVSVLYPLGAGTAGAGLAGLVASLLDRTNEDSSGWLLGMLAGVLVFVYATVLDRANDDQLEVAIDAHETAATPELSDEQLQTGVVADGGNTEGDDQ